MTILIYERENQESQVPDSLFWGSLIPGELRCNRKACDLLLYIRAWILELLCKEPSASEPPVRSFHMKISGPQLRLVKIRSIWRMANKALDFL